ncbi:unnamed protein product [Dicrocoelium dendriticum]|nr:unnamed protein product [Dicrocoelium dendriticum]
MHEQCVQIKLAHRRTPPKNPAHSTHGGSEQCIRLDSSKSLICLSSDRQTRIMEVGNPQCNGRPRGTTRPQPLSQSSRKKKDNEAIAVRNQVVQKNSILAECRSKQHATVVQKRVGARHLQRARTFFDPFSGIHISQQTLTAEAGSYRRIHLWGAALCPAVINRRRSGKHVSRCHLSKSDLALSYSKLTTESEALELQELKVSCDSLQPTAIEQAADSLSNYCAQSVMVLCGEVTVYSDVCSKLSVVLSAHRTPVLTLFFKLHALAAVAEIRSNLNKMHLPISLEKELCNIVTKQKFKIWCITKQFTVTINSLSPTFHSTSSLASQAPLALCVPQLMNSIQQHTPHLLFAQEVWNGEQGEINELGEEFAQAAIDIYFESLTTSKEEDGSICSQYTTSVSIPLSKESNPYAEAADVSDASSSFCAKSIDDNYEPIDSPPHEEEFDWSVYYHHGRRLTQYNPPELEPISGIRSAPTRLENMWDTFGQLLMPYFIPYS